MRLPTFTPISFSINWWVVLCLMLGVGGLVALGGAFTETKDKLDQLRDTVDQINCVGKYNTVSCLAFRLEKSKLDEQYNKDLTALKEKFPVTEQ